MARAYPPSTGIVEFVQEDGIWARRCRITPGTGARGHDFDAAEVARRIIHNHHDLAGLARHGRSIAHGIRHRGDLRFAHGQDDFSLAANGPQGIDLLPVCPGEFQRKDARRARSQFARETRLVELRRQGGVGHVPGFGVEFGRAVAQAGSAPVGEVIGVGHVVGQRWVDVGHAVGQRQQAVAHIVGGGRALVEIAGVGRVVHPLVRDSQADIAVPVVPCHLLHPPQAGEAGHFGLAFGHAHEAGRLLAQAIDVLARITAR